MNLFLPNIWNIIDSFKQHCRLNGWETSETEDWVKTNDGKYHNFLWIQTIYPSTFEKIISNHKCGIRRSTSYEVVDVSFIAWLFKERRPEFIISRVKNNPEWSMKTALFDLSCAYNGENVCRKLNDTNSLIFREFENFLTDEWNLNLKTFDEIPTLMT